MGVSTNPAAVIKAFTYFEDVDASHGATTVVPGSHVLTFDPRDAFQMQHGGVARPLSGAPADGETWEDRPLDDDWTANTYQVQPQSAMVNAHKIVCQAGDVALFDTSTWHTASPNYGSHDRENTIIAYRGAAIGAPPADAGEGGSGGSMAIPREMLEKFDAAGLLNAQRKAMLGFE